MNERTLAPHDVAAATIAAENIDVIRQTAREGHTESGRGMVWLHLTFASEDAATLLDHNLAFVDLAGIAKYEDFRGMAEPMVDVYDPATSFVLCVEWNIGKATGAGNYTSHVQRFDQDMTEAVKVLTEAYDRQTTQSEQIDGLVERVLDEAGETLVTLARDGYRRLGRGMVTVLITYGDHTAVDDAGGAWFPYKADQLKYLPASMVDRFLADADAARARAKEHMREYRPAREACVIVLLQLPPEVRPTPMIRFVRRPLKGGVTPSA